MLKKTIGLLAIMLLTNLAAEGQEQLEYLQIPKEKKIISVEARIGYYWDLQSVPDSIQYPLNDFYEEMGEGPRADFSVLYNWGDNLDIGFTYAYFNATSRTDSFAFTYLTMGGNQRTLRGGISGRATQHYFALRVDPHFGVGRSFSINPGISSGILVYENNTRIDYLHQRISGQSLAFELHLGIEYFLDQNFSINLNGAYMLSFLHEPDVYNSIEEISVENQSVGLSKWYVGFGLRYNFTKKGSAVPAPSNNNNTAPRKKSRFD